MHELQRQLSPFRLADRLAFVVLCSYWFSWPLWYTSVANEFVRLAGFRASDLLLAVVFGLSGGTLLLRRTRSPALRPLLILICYGAVSLTWTPEFKIGLWILINFASVIVFTKILSNDPRRQRYAQLSFLAGVTVTVASVVLRPRLDVLQEYPLSMNRNDFAALCAVATVMIAASLFSELRLKRVLSMRFAANLTLCLLFGNAVFFSGSRTGLAAALLGTAVILFFRICSKGTLRMSHGRFLAVTLLVSAGVVFVQPFVTTESSLLIERYKSPFTEGDFSVRELIVRASFRYLVASPQTALVGGGIGSFDQRIVRFLDGRLFLHAIRHGRTNPIRPFPHLAAHNDFLRILCELGVIGGLLFFLFYKRAWRACLVNVAPDGSLLRIGLLATLVIASMGSDVINFPLYSVTMAMILAPIGLYRTGHRTETKDEAHLPGVFSRFTPVDGAVSKHR